MGALVTLKLDIAPHSRAAIEAQIEALIDLLDTLDGDPDLEDEDPGGDGLERGEADGCYPIMPVYGPDQSTGPRNLHQLR